MARNVFILGAGASRDAGVPLMRDFVPTILQLHDKQNYGPYKDEFDLVIEAFRILESAHAKANMEYRGNLEELFSSFEMAKVINRLGELPIDSIHRLPDAMRRVIVETIERQMLFSKATQGSLGFQPHPEYSKFAKVLQDANKESPGAVSVMTFNNKFDYCLDGQPREGVIPILKLHGSINWAICSNSECSKIVPYTIEDFRKEYGFRIAGGGHPPKLPYQISKRTIEIEHCGQKVLPVPFIVPPTWNKTQYHEQISNVWSNAARELVNAWTIFIIGYSMPKSDEFFRHLFPLSLIGNYHIANIYVISPTETSTKQLKSWAGPDIINVVHHEPIPFKKAAVFIRDKLSR
jgi:hypothetical protein